MSDWLNQFPSFSLLDSFTWIFSNFSSCRGLRDFSCWTLWSICCFCFNNFDSLAGSPSLAASDLFICFTVPCVFTSLISSLLWAFDMLVEEYVFTSDSSNELPGLFLWELADWITPIESSWEVAVNLNSTMLLLGLFDWFSCWTCIHGELAVRSVGCCFLIILDSSFFSPKTIGLTRDKPFDCNRSSSIFFVRT